MESQAVVKKTGSGQSPAVLEYLQKLSGALTKADFQIVQHKYAEKRIDQMQDAEMLPRVAECLLRIHVITGWSLPDDKAYMQVLTEELMNKLKEDFFMLNFQEITFAMRRATGKKDWGKNTNLELICGVLADFCNERERVSREEEKAIDPPPVQKLYTDEELDNLTRWDIELAYQCMRGGRVPVVTEESFIEVLTKDKLLKAEETISDFFVRVLGSGIENIYVNEK